MQHLTPATDPPFAWRKPQCLDFLHSPANLHLSMEQHTPSTELVVCFSVASGVWVMFYSQKKDTEEYKYKKIHIQNPSEGPILQNNSSNLLTLLCCFCLASSPLQAWWRDTGRNEENSLSQIFQWQSGSNHSWTKSMLCFVSYLFFLPKVWIQTWWGSTQWAEEGCQSKSHSSLADNCLEREIEMIMTQQWASEHSCTHSVLYWQWMMPCMGVLVCRWV